MYFQPRCLANRTAIAASQATETVEAHTRRPVLCGETGRRDRVSLGYAIRVHSGVCSSRVDPEGPHAVVVRRSVNFLLAPWTPSLTARTVGLALSPPSIIMRLAQNNLFSLAMATARCLKEDMTDVFGHLTRQCLRLARNPDSVLCVTSLKCLPYARY